MTNLLEKTEGYACEGQSPELVLFQNEKVSGGKGRGRGGLVLNNQLILINKQICFTMKPKQLEVRNRKKLKGLGEGVGGGGKRPRSLASVRKSFLVLSSPGQAVFAHLAPEGGPGQGENLGSLADVMAGVGENLGDVILFPLF